MSVGMYLYDDALARTFEPFATSRPLGEMRVGGLLTRERWARVLGERAVGFIGADHLDGFSEFDAPSSISGRVPAGAWLVNTRALPILSPAAGGIGDVSAITIQGRLAAVRPAIPLETSTLVEGGLPFDAIPAVGQGSVIDMPAGLWLDAPWDIVRHLDMLLKHDIPVLAGATGSRTIEGNRGIHITGRHPVFVEQDAVIEPMTMFDTTAGPILIRRGAHVLAFTRLVGPLLAGCHSTVAGDRVSGSSIGERCRVHGEVSACTFIGHANKGHDGFIGHSVIGRWVNIGAGTTTSNLKNTYGPVALWTVQGMRDTGLQFLGTLFGDHVKTAIGTRLTTGCVVGTGANVLSRGMSPKAIPPFAWGESPPYDIFVAHKFADTAQRMMQRRDVMLSDAQAAWMQRMHAHAVCDTRWPGR